MIIEAMDILNSGAVSGFCLVSSDSDYTRLAMRICEQGVFVMGVGEKKTPQAFVNACEVFVFTENLIPATAIKQKQRSKNKKIEINEGDPLLLLKNVVDLSMQENGWAFLGVIGNHLRQLDPSFDSRTYGFKQLSQLFKSYTDEFEFKEEESAGGTTQIFIRLKDKAG
jgi:hypothetical protein